MLWFFILRLIFELLVLVSLICVDKLLYNILSQSSFYDKKFHNFFIILIDQNQTMRKIASLLTLLLFSVIHIFAQYQIKGKVTDSKDGSPLASISVKEKGTKSGVNTGPDGSFNISITKIPTTLEFSGVGYAEKSLTIINGEIISVALDKEIKNLTEVVVTALGIKREKRSLAYATQTVSSDELNKSGTGNPLAELDGKVSGLTVINSSGDPGAGTYIRLRGVTSLTGDNQPLIVIDGMPIDNSINNYDPTSPVPNVSGASGNLNGGVQPTNRGLDINPNDIESVNILKGPAATALYGIKAASGAIIITTKKGVQGKTNIEVNSSMAFDTYNKLPGLQNSFAQGTGIDETTGTDYLPAPIWVGPDGLQGDGTEPISSITGFSLASEAKRVSWGPAIDTLYWTGISDSYSKLWDSHGRIEGKSSSLANLQMPVTPYNQYDFFKTGLTFNNNIALSGGRDKSTFRLSLGNLNQTGIIPSSQYNKTTISLSGQSNLTDKLNVSSSITYITNSTNKVQQGSNISAVMLGLLRTPPTFDNSNGLANAVNNPASYVVQDGSGTQRDFRGGKGYDNPYWTVNRNPFHGNLDRAYGYGQANYQLFKWMSLTYRLGGDVYSQADNLAYDINSNAFPEGAIYLTNYFNRQFNSDFTINMQRTFSKDLSGSLLLGHNYFYNAFTNQVSTGSDAIVPNFPNISNFVSFQNVAGPDWQKRTMAFYGDAELNYKRMLYLSLTGREEESSTLPANNNTFFYPSASLGWIFTELETLKNSNILSFGKLRLSFAQVGKDAPVQGLQTYFRPTFISDAFTTGISFPIANQGAFQYSSPNAVIGNPDLEPEKTNSYEIGTDLNFLKNRINFSGTYYFQKTTKAIIVVPISFASGFGSELLNAGIIDNTGVEISLNTTPIKLNNGFQWDLNFNWSRNINKVVSLNGVNRITIAGFTDGEVDALAGQAYGQIYGTSYVRATANSNAFLINDDKTSLGYGMPISSSYETAVGNINPDWIGSVISDFSYKGITLGCQIDWKHGGDIYNGTRGALNYFGTGAATANRGKSTDFKGLLGHVDANGNVVHYDVDGSTEIQGAGAANTVTAAYDQYYWQNIGSSFLGPTESDVEDGSFVKLRQISLSYDLPKSIISKAGFKSISFSVFANNIILWTKYSGVDPETSLAGPANGQGLDYFNNPGIKNYGLRLNFGL
jgi:TonB-linked SusC/RagA family outer membrane protein